MFSQSIRFTCLLVMTISACTSAPSDDHLVARVNGQGITKAVFEKAVARELEGRLERGRPMSPTTEQRIHTAVLNRLVEQAVVEQKARELDIEISADRVDEELSRYKASFRTEQAFEQFLQRSRTSEARLKADLHRKLLLDSIMAKTAASEEASADEIVRYYEENQRRFVERERVKAGRILLRLDPSASDADRLRVTRRADELRARAASRGADFAELAREHSEGPEARRGGDLSWQERGRAPADLEAALFQTREGEVSEVVETRNGLEIVKVLERSPERQRPMEEVREAIVRTLSAQARRTNQAGLMRDMMGSAKIEVLVSFDAPARPELDVGPDYAGDGSEDELEGERPGGGEGSHGQGRRRRDARTAEAREQGETEQDAAP